MKHAKSSRIFSLLALVLVVTMLVTLVGCGGSDNKTDDTKKTTTTTTTTVADNTDDATTTTGASTDDTTTGADSSDTTIDLGDLLGTTTQPDKTTKPTTTTSKTLPPADKNILNKVPKELKGTKIKMQIWWNKATDDQKEADEFKKATGISVAYETSEMSKYQSNLSSKIMAGNPPALAAIINEWYPQPITRGLMQNIKATGWDYTDPIYATAMMDQFGYKGEHYGIALKGSNMSTFEVMFFNKKLLASKGINDDPYELWKKGQWNWDTCLDIAKKCTNAKQDKYGLTLIYQNYWMLSAGQDFVLSDANGLKNNIKSEKLRDAWVHAWEMINEHKVIPTMFSQQQQLFYNGSVAMLGGGSYFMQSEASHTNYVPQNCDFDWGVVPFPSPKGQAAVAACEGTVWGFPTKVKGNQLQAAMWFLRYFLDDSTYSARDFYPQEECWEVMGWMWNQKIQSFNSVGVLTYGGKHSAATIQYSLIDEATTTAQVASNLDSWYAELEANINQIKTEME